MERYWKYNIQDFLDNIWKQCSCVQVSDCYCADGIWNEFFLPENHALLQTVSSKNWMRQANEIWYKIRPIIRVMSLPDDVLLGDFYEKDTNYIQKRSGSGPHRAEGLREEQGQYQKVCRDCSIPSPAKRHTAGGLWWRRHLVSSWAPGIIRKNIQNCCARFWEHMLCRVIEI